MHTYVEEEDESILFFMVFFFSCRDPIPVPEKVRKPLTEVQEFNHHVDHRAVDRSEFDQKVKNFTSLLENMALCVCVCVFFKCSLKSICRLKRKK